MTYETAKQAAGAAAAHLIQNQMIVGLGSGSTAHCFIQALALRIEQGLTLKAVVASSRQSEKWAQEYRLPLRDLNDIPYIDITVDGADEIDAQKQIIKGGGGAHVREKILAVNSQEMLVIVDETKWVSQVGVGKLPVEILLFGSPATRNQLEKVGYKGKWRMTKEGSLFLSDNGNPIYDITFPSPPKEPALEEENILRVPGVIDTGFFLNIAGRVITGTQDGLFYIR